MVRKIGRDFLYRYDENPILTAEDIPFRENPILTAEDIPFRCNTVFNGSPVKFEGEYLILFRVEGLQGYSFFALARSRKGFFYKQIFELLSFMGSDANFHCLINIPFYN